MFVCVSIEHFTPERCFCLTGVKSAPCERPTLGLLVRCLILLCLFNADPVSRLPGPVSRLPGLLPRGPCLLPRCSCSAGHLRRSPDPAADVHPCSQPGPHAADASRHPYAPPGVPCSDVPCCSYDGNDPPSMHAPPSATLLLHRSGDDLPSTLFHTHLNCKHGRECCKLTKSTRTDCAALATSTLSPPPTPMPLPPTPIATSEVN